MTGWLLALALAGSAGSDPTTAQPTAAAPGSAPPGSVPPNSARPARSAQADAAPPENSEIADQVRELVFALDAPQRAERDAAEKRLIALGVRALPLLPEPGAAATAEAAARINRIRKALYRAQVESSVRQSLVTLDVKDVPLERVLDDVAKQSGNRLVDYRRQFGQRQGDDDKVTLRLDKKPFWPALDEFLAAQKLEIYHFSGEDGLALVAEGDERKVNPFVAYSGAFRVEAVEVSGIRRLADPAGDLRIDLAAAWEPRLKPLFLTASMAKIAAVDDTGTPLAVANPDLNLEIPPQGKACRVEVGLAFIAPPRSARKIARLSGTLDVLLPADLHEFRFSRLDGPRQTREAAAVAVTVERARINNEVLEVPLRLGYENAGSALESHRAWFYKNPAYLETPEGKKVPPGTIELARQSDDEIVLNLLFAVGDDWNKHVLVYRTPADIVTVPVEFEFRDLPLP